MGVFSNLFGGGAGYNNAGPSAVSSAQVTNEGFDLQKPFIQDIFETAQAETYDIDDDGTKTLRGYEEFLGPRLADFSTEQTEALSGLATLGRQGLAGTDLAASPQYFQNARDSVAQGQGQFTSADAQRLMNPFLDEVIGVQQREAQRNFDSSIQPKLDAEAVAAGSFGGSRAGLLQAEAQRNLQQQLSDISARGRLTAFEQAQKAFEQEQGRQFQGAQLSTALGTEAPAQAARELGLLSSSGEVQQAQEQKALDLAEAEFIRQRDFPMRQLQEYQSLVRGFPFNPSTFEVGSKYSAQPTFGQQLLGGLGAGAGLFGAFGGFSPGKKAGGQVVSRQSGGTVQGGLAGLERHQNNSLNKKITSQLTAPPMQLTAPPISLPIDSVFNQNNLLTKQAPLNKNSPIIKNNQELLNEVIRTNKQKNINRLDFSKATADENKLKSLLEEKRNNLRGSKEEVIAESETDIEGANRNKWMALADMSLDFMGRGGELGDNMFTKLSQSAIETDFTDKIMNAAKEERNAAKELRKNLSDIGNKEIANMATLAGTTREEQKRLVEAEQKKLDSKVQQAKLYLDSQEKIDKTSSEIEKNNRETYKALENKEDAQRTYQLAIAKAKKAGDLSPAAYKAIRASARIANSFTVNPATGEIRRGGQNLLPGSPSSANLEIDIYRQLKGSTGKLPEGQKLNLTQSMIASVPSLGRMKNKEKVIIEQLVPALTGSNAEEDVRNFVNIFSKSLGVDQPGGKGLTAEDRQNSLATKFCEHF